MLCHLLVKKNWYIDLRASLVTVCNSCNVCLELNDFAYSNFNLAQWSTSVILTQARNFLWSKEKKGFSDIPTLLIQSGVSRFDVLPLVIPIFIRFSRFIIKFWWQRKYVIFFVAPHWMHLYLMDRKFTIIHGLSKWLL